jgi:hypothetical protein
MKPLKARKKQFQRITRPSSDESEVGNVFSRSLLGLFVLLISSSHNEKPEFLANSLMRLQVLRAKHTQKKKRQTGWESKNNEHSLSISKTLSSTALAISRRL